MRNNNLRYLAALTLVTSVVMVSTMYLKIPTATGYIHLGDGVFFAAALAFGPIFGSITGALGSSMADILGGYVFWAPWTFLIKGISGWLVGKISYRAGKQRRLTGMIASALFIIAGYAAVTAVMYSPAAVAGEILGNILQTSSAVLVGYYVAPILEASSKKR